MSVDPGIVDLSARIAEYEKRIKRLETLEYETVAFPTGAGPTLISDVVVPAGPGLSTVTLPPVPILIPQTFLHLWLIMSAQNSAPTPAAGFTANVVFNPFAGGTTYRHFVRFENISGVGVGAGDLQTVVPNPASPVIRTVSPAAPGGVNGFRSAAMVIIPDYTNFTTMPNKAAMAFGYAFGQDDGEGDVTQAGGDTAGGAGAAAPAIGAITSILVGSPFGVFVPGSQFTLYGL